MEKSTHVIPTTTTNERTVGERRYGKRRDGERRDGERRDGVRRGGGTSKQTDTRSNNKQTNARSKPIWDLAGARPALPPPIPTPSMAVADLLQLLRMETSWPGARSMQTHPYPSMIWE